MQRRLRAIDPILALIVLAGFALTARHSAVISEWLVMTDELQHSKLALNFSRELVPAPTLHGLQDDRMTLYSLVISPFFGLLSVPGAFRGAHIFNALLLASTAIPAYLLARNVTASRLWSNVAAAFTVAVPWLGVAVGLMTENAAYPAFVWAIFAIHAAVTSPSMRNDLLAVAAVGVAYFARAQFVVLVAVLPAVVVLHEVGYAMAARERLSDAVRRAVRGHVALSALVVAGLLVVAALMAGGRLGTLLGDYEVTARQGSLLPDGIAEAMAVHFDYVAVGAGVLPALFAAAFVLGALVRPSGRSGHAFAVLALLLVPGLTFMVASYDLRFVGGAVSDRYLFYIAPLLFVGAAAFFAEARRRWVALGAVTVPVALLMAIPGYLSAPGPYFDRPAVTFHRVLDGRALQLGRQLGIGDLGADTALLIVVLAAGAGVSLLLASRRVSKPALGLVVLVPALALSGGQAAYALRELTFGANGGRGVPSGNPIEGRDWIDEAVGADADVGLVPSQEGTYPVQTMWWEVEFWNKSVTQAYRFGEGTTYTNFPASRLRVDPGSGRLHGRITTQFVVVSANDTRFTIVGRVVARRDQLLLVQPDRPWRVAWTNRGSIGDPAGARVRVFADRAGRAQRVAVAVSSGAGAQDAARFALAGDGDQVTRVVEPGATTEAVIRVCVPPGGHRDITVRPRQSRQRASTVELFVSAVRTAPARTCR